MKDICLIISANNNIKTFSATLFAIKEECKKKQMSISKIIVIRTLQGEKQEIVNEYKQKCELIFPDYAEYSEMRIASSQHYISELPSIFRNCLSNWRPDCIFVDLTNGTKTYTDFIYLACTLLDIKNIFRISISREYYKEDATNNSSYFTFELEAILSQYELRNFVNKTYAEYVYYYNEVNELSDWMCNCLGEQYSNEFFSSMLKAFEKYTASEYSECIIQLSTLTERLLNLILNKLKNNFDDTAWDWLTGNDSFQRSRSQRNAQRNITTLGSLSLQLGTILTRANKIISDVRDRSTALPEVAQIKADQNVYKLTPIIAAGHALQSMAMIRNYNAHGSNFSIHNATMHDARYQIDVLLFIFKKMSECELLGGTTNVRIS